MKNIIVIAIFTMKFITVCNAMTFILRFWFVKNIAEKKELKMNVRLVRNTIQNATKNAYDIPLLCKFKF